MPGSGRSSGTLDTVRPPTFVSSIRTGGTSMLSHDPTDTADQSDVLTCWSAVRLLQAGQPNALPDEQLALHLEGLLSAVSQELEADVESIPKAVRRAAVDVAAHIVRQSSIPVRRWHVGAEEPARHPGHRNDHAPGIPFSHSIRLGRMG
jgi:hypothetical protein